MHQAVLISVVIAIVILVVYILWKKNKSMKQTSPATSGYLPVVQPTGYWATEKAGQYTCAGTTDTSGNYCMLPLSQAQAYCSNDPKCTGYVTGTGLSWLQNQAQLVTQPLASNSAFNNSVTTLYSKSSS